MGRKLAVAATLFAAFVVNRYFTTWIFDMGGKNSSLKDVKFGDLEAKDIDGGIVKMSEFLGHPTIIVNVASQWGVTDREYTQLQQLINTFGDDLKVLAFPCNQFGKQEPGTAKEIKEFVKKYNFTGRLFTKCDVNGADAHPVFQWLKAQDAGSGTLTDNIKWNFTKFLLDKQGKVVGRWGTVTAAGDLEKEIRKLL